VGSFYQMGEYYLVENKYYLDENECYLVENKYCLDTDGFGFFKNKEFFNW
jgi:hypothetical protein